MRLVDLAALRALRVNTDRYGAAQDGQRKTEYPRTQEVGEAALTFSVLTGCKFLMPGTIV